MKLAAAAFAVAWTISVVALIWAATTDSYDCDCYTDMECVELYGGDGY